MTPTVYYVRRSPTGGINITTAEENVVSFGHGTLGQLAYDIWKDGLARRPAWVHAAILLDEDGSALVGDVADLAP